MAKTESVMVSYEGTVKPKKTTFLESEPIKMDFLATIELADSDIANAKNVQKEFQSAMKSQLDTQVNALNTWLAEKDKMIAGMMKDYDAFLKAGLPVSESDANKRSDQLRDLKMDEKVEALKAEWQSMVTDWAENARKQQGRVAVTIAVKAARVKTFSDKTWRVRSAQAIKIGLVVSAIVLGAAAIILTAGTATPLVLGIAIASGAVSGLASIGDLGLSLSKNWNIEKKLMANLTADVEKVREAMDAASQAKGNLAKHVTEMKNLINIRTGHIKELEGAIQKAEAPAQRMLTDLIGLAKDKSLDPSNLAKRRVEAIKMVDGIKETRARIAKLEEDNAQSLTVLADLERMVGDLSGLSTRTANTLGDNLKKKFGSLEGVMDVGKQVMGLGQAAGGLAKSV